MDLDTELDDFRALSLILQHRVLERELDAITAAIEACQSAGTTEHETAALLLPMLRRFTLALPEHFAAESKSTASLLRDTEDAEFERRLQQLDSEHPQLLTRFQGILLQMSGQEAPAGVVPLRPPLDRVIADLVLAVAVFRRHESEEDALFVD